MAQRYDFIRLGYSVTRQVTGVGHHYIYISDSTARFIEKIS